LLKLAKQFGNVSQAYRMIGYSRDSSYRFKVLYDQGSKALLRRRLAAGSRSVSLRQLLNPFVTLQLHRKIP
jgi:hypothetical protein